MRRAAQSCYNHCRTIFNGNGKLPAELRFAVEKEVLINCDSEFDLDNIAAAAKSVGKPARVMIRINPDIDPEVHPYISTGLANSKFGIRNSHLQVGLAIFFPTCQACESLTLCCDPATCEERPNGPTL